MVNGLTTSIAPGGGTLTIASGGTFDIGNWPTGGTTVGIKGDVLNNGNLATGVPSNGGGGNNNTLNIAGMLTNSGAFGLYGTFDMATIGGGLVNSGFVDLENRSTLIVNGAVNNSGTLALDYNVFRSGNTLNITGSLTNSGTFELLGPQAFGGGAPFATATVLSLTNSAGGIVGVENGSTLTVNGPVDNSGTLAIIGGPFNRVSLLTVQGLLTNEATGQISLGSASAFGGVLQALGGLTNNGQINVLYSSVGAPFLNNGGTISVNGIPDFLSKFVVGTGNPAGSGYIQLANGTLGEMISAQNSFGVINVNGSALLNGTLDILLQGGFNPRVGSIFQFLFANPGQISGTFASIENDFFNNGTEQWLVTYDNADGVVELTAEQAGPIAEPATLLVLIPGLLGAGYGLRRKLLM